MAALIAKREDGFSHPLPLSTGPIRRIRRIRPVCPRSFSPAPLPFAEEQSFASLFRGKTTARAPFSFPEPLSFSGIVCFSGVGKSMGEICWFCNGCAHCKTGDCFSHPLGRGRTNSRLGTPAFRGRIVSPGNRCLIRLIRLIPLSTSPIRLTEYSGSMSALNSANIPDYSAIFPENPHFVYARTRSRTPGGYQGVIPQPPALL